MVSVVEDASELNELELWGEHNFDQSDSEEVARAAFDHSTQQQQQVLLARISEGDDDTSESGSDLNFDDDLETELPTLRDKGVTGPASQRVTPHLQVFRPEEASTTPLGIPLSVPNPNRLKDLPGSTSQLGTSAPINIPANANRRLLELEADEKRFAATFVPPHLLEQQSAEEMSTRLTFSGISPSASLKRERLLQRNAILRSTGFIESAGIRNSVVETMDPIKESQLGAMTLQVGFDRSGDVSALSQALDTQG